MNATTGIAVLATFGLLALTACIHDDDSERPVTDETDVTTEFFDDLLGANLLNSSTSRLRQRFRRPCLEPEALFSPRPSTRRMFPAYPRASTAVT